jgi:hypothetical protein
MDIHKAHYCSECGEIDEPIIKFTKDRVKQYCPKCHKVLSQAGCFNLSIYLLPNNTRVNVNILPSQS